MVKSLSTAELASRLAQGKRPVLIDARQPEEYAVSHLSGALQATSVQDFRSMGFNREADIVVYCSIGYRSARLAQRLEAAGYTAKNLEGSLFQWANEARLLVDDAGQTTRVHPYSAMWGLLLKPRNSKL